MTNLIPGYKLQPSLETFIFEIVKDTANFKKYYEFTKKKRLVKDISTFDSMSDLNNLEINDYLYIVQKSELWLHLRSLAIGTASAVGKMLKGPPKYPTMEQVSEAWYDKITNKPFEVTPTMKGHMKWGVDHEEPALIHFAVDNMLSVTEVGTIYLPVDYIMSLADDYIGDDVGIFKKALSFLKDTDKHFLVSPDGLVNDPESGDLIGMLEIKCISPFHHVANSDETLCWVDDMETRQWYTADEIPYVYVTQICMQALSGLYRLDMSRSDTMWFIRWSPCGFSEFKVSFEPLIKMGTVSCLLYLLLKERVTTVEDLPFSYNENEIPLVRLLDKYYKEVLMNMTHRYVDHTNLYPEFHLYRRLTEFHNFSV